MKYFVFIFLFALSVDAAVYEPFALWQKKEIRLCFVGDKKELKETYFSGSGLKYEVIPLTQSQKDLVKEVATSAFNPEETIVHFVGFKNCTEDKSADVYLFSAKQLKATKRKHVLAYGAAAVGERAKIESPNMFTMNLMGRQNKKKNYLYINFSPIQHKDWFIDYSLLLPHVIAHELGHVLGLKHEHGRAEMKEDENCSLTNRRKEMLYTSSVGFEQYDPESVMNYCYLHGAKEGFFPLRKEYLSDHDKKTLYTIYSDLL